MRWAILDTNIYIGHWERSLYEDTLAIVRRRYIVRYSAVVLSELRRGARDKVSRRLVESLASQAKVLWTPLGSDWWEAGKLIREVGDAESWDKSKRRDFQNDALIALTARRYGATVVTANRYEFELLSKALGLPLLVV